MKILKTGWKAPSIEKRTSFRLQLKTFMPNHINGAVLAAASVNNNHMHVTYLKRGAS
jgi:hypothetical protein